MRVAPWVSLHEAQSVAIYRASKSHIAIAKKQSKVTGIYAYAALAARDVVDVIRQSELPYCDWPHSSSQLLSTLCSSWEKTAEDARPRDKRADVEAYFYGGEDYSGVRLFLLLQRILFRIVYALSMLHFLPWVRFIHSMLLTCIAGGERLAWFLKVG